MDNRRDKPANDFRSPSYPNRPLVVPARGQRRSGPVIDVVRPVAKPTTVQPVKPAVQTPQPISKPVQSAVVSRPQPIAPHVPAATSVQNIEPKTELPARRTEPTKRRSRKRHQSIKQKLTGWQKWRRILFNLLIVLLILAAAYMTYDTWRTNNEVKQSLTGTSQAVAGDKTQAVSAAVGDGKDITPLPAGTLANYKVAADLPRAIYIDKLGVAARLLPMGVNKDSSMQAPNNIYDAGWYTGSSKPGQNGAMVVDGHASQTGTHYGLFGKLENLVNGDKITIEKGDGTKLSFAVAKVEVVALKDVDMTQVMVSYGSSTQGLNLITCAGDWTKDGKTLDHRVIVFAVPTA